MAYFTHSSTARWASLTADAATVGRDRIEDHHRDLEGHRLFAQPLTFGTTTSSSADLGGVRRALPQLIELLADAEAGRSRSDDKRAHPAMLGGFIGVRKHDAN
ncbi:MAG: hypothetical protein U0559_17620 [Anaerolineae bacterium]